MSLASPALAGRFYTTVPPENSIYSMPPQVCNLELHIIHLQRKKKCKSLLQWLLKHYFKNVIFGINVKKE